MKITSEMQARGLKPLGNKNLPVLPSGALFLIKSLTDDSMDFDKLAEIVERYPSIATRMIALANSAWSSPVNQIHSIEMACSRLGMNIVRSLGIALAVASPFDAIQCAGFDAQRFWYNALMTAEASSMLAARIETGYDASTARTAGLLHNMGLMLIVDQYPEELSDVFLQIKRNKYSRLQQGLNETLGFDAADAGRYLGENWLLPSPLIHTMGYFQSHNYQGGDWKLVNLVYSAIQLVSAHAHGHALQINEATLKQMDLDVDDLDTMLERLKQHGKKMKELASTLFKT